jgi:hypothetical protein
MSESEGVKIIYTVSSFFYQDAEKIPEQDKAEACDL